MARPTSREDQAWEVFLVMLQGLFASGRIYDPARIADRAFLAAEAFDVEARNRRCDSL
jgi:hypothetical protein